MLNDELINEIINIDTNDEKFYICYICLVEIENILKKETLTTEDIKEIVILNSIFEKNIEKILNKEVTQFLKKEREKHLNIKQLKKEKILFKAEKGEIEIYLKKINEDIKKIREQKELKIQEQKELEKQKELKELKKQKDKNINEDVKNILGNDNLSF